MNLLDTASLVVTPNGYKASKLYSIIPSDGTGDMTFARTGDTATRVNSSGLIETVLANKPRLDYLGSTCPKLLLEPQRTNLVTYSNDFDNAAWGYSGCTITANQGVSPDGSQNAELISSTSANGSVGRAVSITANSSTYTQTLYVKWVSGYELFKFRIALSGGTAVDTYLDLNIRTGAFVASNGTYKIESCLNGWFRLSISVTNNSTNTTAVYQIFNTKDSTQTESCYIYGAQLEAGAYATSYIPTTTASVTRNADSCYKTSATALIGQTEGTIYAEFANTAKLAGGRYFSLSDGTGANRIDIYASTTSQIAVYAAKSSTAILNTNVSLTANSSFKFAIGYKAGSWVWYVNGVQIITSTDSNVPTLTAIQLSTNAVGDPSGEGVLFKSGALWKTRLTNQELVTLTTL